LGKRQKSHWIKCPECGRRVKQYADGHLSVHYWLGNIFCPAMASSYDYENNIKKLIRLRGQCILICDTCVKVYKLLDISKRAVLHSLAGNSEGGCNLCGIDRGMSDIRIPLNYKGEEANDKAHH
jgi:hypothetical protein